MDLGKQPGPSVEYSEENILVFDSGFGILTEGKPPEFRIIWGNGTVIEDSGTTGDTSEMVPEKDTVVPSVPSSVPRTKWEEWKRKYPERAALVEREQTKGLVAPICQGHSHKMRRKWDWEAGTFEWQCPTERSEPRPPKGVARDSTAAGVPNRTGRSTISSLGETNSTGYTVPPSVMADMEKSSGYRKLVETSHGLLGQEGMLSWISLKLNKGVTGDWKDPAFVIQELLADAWDLQGQETERKEGKITSFAVRHDTIDVVERLIGGAMKAGADGVGTSWLMQKTGKGKTVIRRAIRELEDQGRVERVGSGFDTEYRVLDTGESGMVD